MMALHNMDELMDVELDPPEMEGSGNRVFGSTHACVCNPLNRPHYPEDWYAFHYHCIEELACATQVLS